MKICVVGMWHLGSVSAASLASLGHRVVGFDDDTDTIAGLRKHRAPLFEPGLDDLILAQSTAGNLSFTHEPHEALADAELIWIAYDTPVDEDDVADVDGVVNRVKALLSHAARNAVVVVSSQLVAGCTRELAEACARAYPDHQLEFAYSPENLRLGKAIEAFLNPDRIVVGTDSDHAREVIARALTRLSDRVLWMSVESAEMTKHAINAFLAMCVSFSNELASICEYVGADAKQVEQGLKSEKRIGPSAYVAPGAAFAGGTLARDVQFLRSLAKRANQPAHLVASIKESNDRHRDWAQRKLTERFGTLRGVRVAVLGLTYKPGTDTLRRSTSIELCKWLIGQGAEVTAHDPRVRTLPAELASQIRLESRVEDALRDAQGIVIGTPWPEYKALAPDSVLAATQAPVVLDANRVAGQTLNKPEIEYISVGTPSRRMN